MTTPEQPAETTEPVAGGLREKWRAMPQARRNIALFFLIGLPPAIYFVLDPTIDPRGVGWQPIQSLNAIGGGGLFGQGYKLGVQNRGAYLPEDHTDYIFSVVAEEWGFAGSMLLLGLYTLLLTRLGRAAALARDRPGAMIAMGTLLFLAAHLLVNGGMVVGLMPTIGIPLLLLSYGGSALLATFVMLGLTASVGVRRHAR